jgi:hypothetical protein
MVENMQNISLFHLVKTNILSTILLLMVQEVCNLSPRLPSSKQSLKQKKNVKGQFTLEEIPQNATNAFAIMCNYLSFIINSNRLCNYFH